MEAEVLGELVFVPTLELNSRFAHEAIEIWDREQKGSFPVFVDLYIKKAWDNYVRWN